MNGAASPLPSPNGERVLLVEGEDDKHVVEHIYWRCLDVEPPLNVVDNKGPKRPLEAIEPQFKAPER